MRIFYPWLIVIIAAALTSCGSITQSLKPPISAQPQTELITAYTELAKAGGTLFTLDPQQSTVRIYVFRGGRFAALGHNHVLSAPKFVGFFYMPSADPTEARFDLKFRLDQLELDDPTIRASLGPAFASKLSAEAITSTREHMLGTDNLQADQFPLVRIHSMQIVGAAPKFAVKIQIQLHGQTRRCGFLFRWKGCQRNCRYQDPWCCVKLILLCSRFH